MASSKRQMARKQRASLYQMDRLDADAVEDEEEALEKMEQQRIRRHKNKSK